MTVDLYPHQTKVLNEIKNGSVVKGGVGTGKSITAIAYFFTKVCEGQLKMNGKGDWGEMKKPRDLYIITTAKKRNDKDWEKECAPFILSSDPTISFGGVKVTVDSWNNIVNYKDVKDAFFIFDEQRLVGAGAWVKAFLKIASHNQWIILSATPGDTWSDYIPIFLAHGFYANRTEFAKRHIVYKPFAKFPQIDRYVETGILESYRRRVVVDMPYARHTKRHIQNVLVPHNEVMFRKAWKDRWHIFEERPIKDVAELFSVVRKLVNSDPSRIEEITKIQEKHPRLIIFYNFNYELEILRTLGEKLGVPIAEWNGHKHEPIPAGEKWVYLVQYTAGAEGWNCITTDATVFYSLNYSYKINEQARGRIDRINTQYTDLYYYYLRSSSQIDQAIWKSIVTKKNFNEKEFIGGTYGAERQAA